MLPNQTTKRYGSAPSVQVFSHNSLSKKDRRKIAACCSVPTIVISSILCVFVLGMYMCFIYILEVDPRPMAPGFSIGSLGDGGKKHQLPVVNVKRKFFKSEFTELPDWSKEQWTPISVTNIHVGTNGRVDATLTLCQLDFETYSKTPHQYPMFRDLVSMSKCNHGTFIQNHSTLSRAHIVVAVVIVLVTTYVVLLRRRFYLFTCVFFCFTINLLAYLFVR